MLDGGLFAVAGVGAGALFVIFILWSILWKGLALWISAKEQKKWWFIVMLIINTAGILEIVYILGFSEAGRNYLANLKAKREAKSSAAKSSGVTKEEAKEVKAKEVSDDKKENKCEKCDHEEGKCDCDCHKED